MENKLLFFTNNDIPFTSAKIVIHNPTIKEIGLIGETTFRIAVHLILYIPKIIRKSQDNSGLSNKSDFEIFIAIVNNKDQQEVNAKQNFMSLLFLLFPNFEIKIRERDIQLVKAEEGIVSFIDDTNFLEFQQILSKMFPGTDSDKNVYIPADSRAQAIANKLMEGKNKKNKELENEKDISVYKRYASILSIGLQMDLNTILNYTVEQIETQFQRYILKVKWDAHYAAQLACATGLDEAEDWMSEV